MKTSAQALPVHVYDERAHLLFYVGTMVQARLQVALESIDGIAKRNKTPMGDSVIDDETLSELREIQMRLAAVTTRIAKSTR